MLQDGPEGMTLFLPGLEVRQSEGSSTVTATRYIDLPGGVTYVETTGSPPQYQVTDHHGTATLLLDPDTGEVTHRRMDPYGNSRGTEPAGWPGQRGFVGGTIDPTGYTHLGAREYDPAIGRFISLDPIMDLTDPQQIHGYTYANNNPTTWSDPTGHSPDVVQHDLGGYSGNSTSPTVSSQTTQTSSGGDWLETDPVTKDVVINGVIVPPDLVADPQQLFDEIAAQIGQLPGSENRHNSPEDLAFYTIWAITWVCAGEANRHLQCGPQILELQQVFAMASANRSGGGLNIPQELLEAAVAAGWGFVGGFRGGLRGGGGRSAPARPGTRPGCRNSFTPDTLVLMADGSHKPIPDVEVGDLVLATDPETGLTQAQPVTDTITGHGEKLLVEISIATGASPTSLTIGQPTPTAAEADITATITATGNHPIWVTNTTTWTNAANLQPGDQLHTHTGNDETAKVTNLDTHRATLTVHNLTIAVTPTYYVIAGNTPVLVHNTPPGDCRITSNAGSPQFTSRTVWTNGGRTMRVDVENPRPGQPGAAGIHVQFRGRGADPAKYYYNPSNGMWVSEQGAVLSPRIAQQIPQSAIVRANQYLGIP